MFPVGPSPPRSLSLSPPSRSPPPSPKHPLALSSPLQLPLPLLPSRGGFWVLFDLSPLRVPVLATGDPDSADSRRTAESFPATDRISFASPATVSGTGSFEDPGIRCRPQPPLTCSGCLLNSAIASWTSQPRSTAPALRRPKYVRGGHFVRESCCAAQLRVSSSIPCVCRMFSRRARRITGVGIVAEIRKCRSRRRGTPFTSILASIFFHTGAALPAAPSFSTHGARTSSG